MTVRWGIIGIGKVADIAIAPAIGADDQSGLAAVYSRSLDRAKTFADKHGAAVAYDDYSQMLADPDVDVVYIASPNGLHAAHGLAALKSGKHGGTLLHQGVHAVDLVAYLATNPLSRSPA